MSAPVSNATQSAAPSPNSLAQAKLNMQDFLHLLTVQLQNQDPMNPMKDTEFFAQMAQLGQVEGIDQLNNSSAVQQAQSLMGQTVTAANTDQATSSQSPTVTGVVKALSIQGGTYYLGIQQADGTMATVPMSALQSVQQTPNISSVSDMVGHTVTGNLTVNGKPTTVTGSVTGVSLTNGVPTLTVKPKTGTAVTMSLSQVTSVTN